MRVRTEGRRDAIIAAAAELFRELGFERTSMAAIAARVGGSKTTLYGYFKSKEELFTVVMQSGVEEQAHRLFTLLLPATNDIPTMLEQFGHAYLDLILSPKVLDLHRLGIADGSAGSIGPLLYAAGPGKGARDLADHFARWSQEGRIKIADPLLAALQWRALLEAGLLEPHLYGAPESRDRETVVRSAVTMFLCSYPAL